MASIEWDNPRCLYTGMDERSSVPRKILTTMDKLVFAFGLSKVDQMLATGTIQIIKGESDGRVGGLYDSHDEVNGE